MGFINSFKSQIGRDTGKVVSNYVWGDKHASVYRRAQSRYSSKKFNEREEAAFEKLVQEQKIEKAQAVVDSGIEKVIAMKVPQDKEHIIEMLEELTTMLIANPWGSIVKDELRITNKYSDAILVKYEQALFALKTKFPNEVENAYFEKQFLDFQKTRKKKKYTEVALISIFCIVLFSIVGIMAHNEQSEHESKGKIFEKIESIIK
ncbi:hypothetical protein [Paludibacter sp.]|uniref:hypothetical protein n=1 Tax=Paludibacter sp. TaxID=1898105 RepID=UPI001354D7FB|nr:hypothetical protein [Paludibacter sp.]MTK53880.1 hypothetical protein [Paludibacter sp.]